MARELSILAIRVSRLGDVLFTTPALQILRHRLPEARIEVLTSTSCVPALRGLDFLDQVYGIPKKVLRSRPWAWLSTRRFRRRYDVVFSFSLRSHHLWLARSLGAEHVFGPARSSSAPVSPSYREHRVAAADRAVEWSLIPAVRPEPSLDATHVVAAHCQTVGQLVELKPDEIPPLAIYRTAEDHTWVRETLAEAGVAPDQPFVAIHPGFHGVRRGKDLDSAGKRGWPVEHWSELARQLNASGLAVAVSSGTRAEGRIAQRIRADAGPGNACVPGPSIGQLAALIESATAFIGLDSGPMHVAAAVGTPTVALFGPSRPQLTGPWLAVDKVNIVRSDLPCSPCKGLKVSCPLNQCMRIIQPGDIVQALLAIQENCGTA